MQQATLALSPAPSKVDIRSCGHKGETSFLRLLPLAQSQNWIRHASLPIRNSVERYRAMNI